MFYNKYLKYKIKYNNLKNQKGGLPLTLISDDDINYINRFKLDDLE
jgi:hypothetical protein